MDFEKILDFLKSRYQFHGAVLYGSRAGNSYRTDSDYDVLCLQKDGIRIREILTFEDITIDLIIENETVLFSQLPLVSLWQHIILLDEFGTAKKLIDENQNILSKPPPPMSASRKKQRKKQILDSLKYLKEPGILADYRRHDLFPKLLDLYFGFTQNWDFGDKYSFNWLEKNDPKTFHLFQKAMTKEASLADIETLVDHIHSL